MQTHTHIIISYYSFLNKHYIDMKQIEDGEDSDQFYQELEEEELATLKRHIRGRKGARGSRSNSETQNMYKEALMDSIFGRFQEASRKLKLMITLVPDSPQPYHLLGTMHQENGQLDKAAEYLFMSTYLSPPNLQKWLKVGDLSFQRKMYNQAAYCFGRALKIASCDPKIMVRRAQAFELGGQPKKAISTYKRLLGISNSPEYVKKYAKLRYRRAQYSLCRQILQSIADYATDPHIVFMACQTYLKEHSYEQAVKLLQTHLQLRQQQMQENEQLPAQFIIVLLVCSVALKRQCYGLNTEILLEQAKQCYQQQYAELYAECSHHLSQFDQQYGFKMASFLITYPQHKTVTNYVMVTDYLCRQKNERCLSILQQALNIHPHAPQLLAQRDYIHKCFGIGGTLRQPQAIFYSDQDELVAQALPFPRRRGVVEPVDSQVMQKLILNVSQSLHLQLQQVRNGKIPGSNEQQTVLDGLDFFISLAPVCSEKGDERQGLYMKKVTRRRNIEGQTKINAIYEHIGLVIKYFQDLVQYLQGLLSHKQWRKLFLIGERVSKVHVFKNHTKSQDFTAIKIRIYQISVLGCLAVNKFNTALFFLRYLATKHPQDSLYLLALHILLKICPKKTFLSSALSKRLNNPGGQHLARLLAMQYMQTGCFDLAANTLLRSSQNGESFGPTPQLCLAACLIQIASSRNTYNKLDFTNRSALCLASYQSTETNKWESLYNKGRWYAQVKLNHKAINCFESILSGNADIRIKQRAAYCLICIFRDCEQYLRADKLSQEYFSVPEGAELQQNGIQ